MELPSMVEHAGNRLVVRSLVSGATMYQTRMGLTEVTAGNLRKTVASHPLVDAELLDQQLQLLNNRAVGTFSVMPAMVEPLFGQVDAKKSPEELPQCKIRRNYSCNSCAFFTQNPRSHLSHLRDVHGEKIVINECKLCLYASRHFQKLVRHMKMVHGCSDNDNGGMTGRRHCNRQARKRRLEESIEVPAAATTMMQGGPTLKQLKSKLQTLQQQLLQSVEAFNRQRQQQQLQHLVSRSGNIFSIAFELQLCMWPSTMSMSTSTSFDTSLPLEVEREAEQKSSSDSEEVTQVEDCLTPDALDLSTGNSVTSYQCQKCSYCTPIRARFKKHVKYHSMPLIKCGSCDFHSPYKWNLDRHTKNHGANGFFKCTVCDFSTNIKQSLTIHELNHHVTSRCQASEDQAATVKSVEQLEPTREETSPSSEKETDLAAPPNELPQNALEIVQHLQQRKPILGNTTNLNSDTELGNEEDYRGNDLGYCGVETAPGYGEVIEHLQPEDSDALKKVFKCPHCSFWAATASRFHVHIVGHLNRKPFECSLCSYRSNWRWDITKHIRLKTMRDKSHVLAEVLMNDETGRRNYAKYNQYLTLMKVNADQAADAKTMRCGEMQSTNTEQPMLNLPQPEDGEESGSDSLAALDLSVSSKPLTEQTTVLLETNMDGHQGKQKSKKKPKVARQDQQIDTEPNPQKKRKLAGRYQQKNTERPLFK